MKEEALLPDVSECISKFKLTFKNVTDSEIEALFMDNAIKFYKKGEYIYNEEARIKDRSRREGSDHSFRKRR